jgi:hypothetical protein
MPRDPHPPTDRLAPDPRLALVRAFATLWLEVEAGRRPPAQLFWLMDARLVSRLAEHLVRRAGPPGEVRAVTGVQTAPGRYEAVAVVQRGARAGALALRLVHDDVAWKVTEVVRPEGAPAPADGALELAS